MIIDVDESKYISQLNTILSDNLKIDSSYTDLTNLKTYTIDDSSSLEIDDAISFQRLNNKNKIWIHISSPSEYIDIGTPIDVIASNKASTSYLPHAIDYMLPSSLITNILSFKQNKTSVALSISIEINDEGDIHSYDIYRSLVKTSLTLTYDEADEILDLQPREEQDLCNLHKYLTMVKSKRIHNGAINIEEEQGKFYLEDNIAKHKIIAVSPSRILISEAMILFGHLLARFCDSNNIHVPYRSQEKTKVIPDINLSSTDLHLRNFILKNSLSRSVISHIPNEHAGLGLNKYVQATSPIRRYIDLLVHYQVIRFLKSHEQLKQDLVSERIELFNIRYPKLIQLARSSQRDLAVQWFKQSADKSWRVVFLKWLNKSKYIALLYFKDLEMDLACFISSISNANLGKELEVSLSKDIISTENIHLIVS